MFRVQPIVQPLHTEQFKKGGKVKAKAKGKAKAVATATANPTVHIHVTRRQANRRPTAPQRSYGQAPVNAYVNVSPGDFGMENQLMRMFQQLQTAPVKSTVPLRNQGMQTVAVDNELPEQVHNIQNIRRDDPSRAMRHDLAMNANRLEQLARASALSRASHYPSSVDSGDPFDARSIPFSHHSYGDEWNTQGRGINEPASAFAIPASQQGYYQDYEDFSYPAEPALSEPSAFGLPSVPASAPVGSTPFTSVNDLHRENQIEREKYEGKEEIPTQSEEEAIEDKKRVLARHRIHLGDQTEKLLKAQVLKLGISIGRGNRTKGQYIQLLMDRASKNYDEYGVV
jgi:hypothetical protein